MAKADTIFLGQIRTKRDGLRLKTDVSDLVESIKEIGVLQPIKINKADKQLVFGGRRYTAMKKMGLKKLVRGVHFDWMDGASVDRDIAHIDENLARKELPDYVKDELNLERKKLYEKKHPESRSENISVNALKGRKNLKSYSKDAADRQGVSKRTVQLSTRRAEKLDKAVHRSALKTTLKDQLTSLTHAEQKKVLPYAKKMDVAELKRTVRKIKMNGVESALVSIKNDRWDSYADKLNSQIVQMSNFIDKIEKEDLKIDSDTRESVLALVSKLRKFSHEKRTVIIRRKKR